jgi:hypothetical protein
MKFGAPTTKSGAESPVQLPTLAREVPNAAPALTGGEVIDQITLAPCPLARKRPDTHSTAPAPLLRPGAPTSTSVRPSPSWSPASIAAAPNLSPLFPLKDWSTCCASAGAAPEHSTNETSRSFTWTYPSWG